MSKDFPESKKRLNALTKELAGKVPTVVSAFGQLHKNALADGALPAKHKELIALGIAIAARCEGCIAYHVSDALRAGATRQEIEETIGVAVLMGGGTAMVYGCEALDALKQFTEAA